jgi:AcrR family transcriptional regulator
MNSGSKNSAARSPRLRERLKEATRGTILDAAESVFARDGVQGARMEDVAAAAGVAVGTLYNYFEDREALLELLLQARRREFLSRLDAALADASQAFEARLQAFFAATFGYFREHMGLFALHMEAELALRARRNAKRPALQAVLDRASALIKDGVASGALRADEAELYPALLMGMLRGLFMRHLHGLGPLPGADAAQAVTRIFLRGAGKERRR